MINYIYLVSEGSYDDYHIDSAYTDKSVAEERAAQILGCVEEFPLDMDLKYPSGTRGFIIYMDINGSVIRAEPGSLDYLENMENFACSQWISDLRQYHSTGRMGFSVICQGDEKQAIQIVNEQRLLMIAAGTWPKAGERI